MMRRLTIAALLVSFAIAVAAQEGTDDDVFDDPFATDESDADGAGAADDEDYGLLFGDDMIDTADESRMTEDPQDELLQQEGVRWGGNLRGSITADWAWNNAWQDDFDITDPSSDSLSPSVGATLTFDARPEPEFRVFGKLNVDTTENAALAGLDGLDMGGATIDPGLLPPGWTAVPTPDGDLQIYDDEGDLVFTVAADGTAGEDEADEPTTGNAPGLEIAVFELFADFTWKDTLFFRFGKHTIKWGTGYFFSPADILNLTAVDAENPTADREGPYSLRSIYPFGITGNAYLYLIANDNAGVLDVALAPKVELVLGPGELGIGAYYQRALAPRLVALYTASAGDVDLFGEGVASWGSDRVFVRPSGDQAPAEADPDDDWDLVVETYEVDDRPFVQATLGARYLKEWENEISLALIGQYLFNGEGYTDEEPGLLPAAAALLLNPAQNGAIVADPDADPPAIGVGDLTNWGRHYVGATASVSNVLIDDLSLSAFGLVNLSDFSGIVTPAITWRFLDRFSLGLSARFTFGQSTDEYTDPASLLTGADAAPTFGITLDLGMPGGSF